MSDIVHHIQDHILHIRLNRPAKLNALNAELLDALSDLFTMAQITASIKAVLLIGEGKAFCAGADIARLGECDSATGYAFALQGQRILRQLETLGKPSLAAINGYAFGGGCELAMAASLRIASVAAQFAQPEIKLGVIPGYGGTQRLARLVGKGRALDLCLTGRTISAETAEQWGLVAAVVPGAELEDKAIAMLHSMVAMAPLALEAIMATIDTGYDLPLTDALTLEALQFARMCATEDKQEGVAAFLARRLPVFKGV